jgi:hypothetical protein
MFPCALRVPLGSIWDVEVILHTFLDKVLNGAPFIANNAVSFIVRLRKKFRKSVEHPCRGPIRGKHFVHSFETKLHFPGGTDKNHEIRIADVLEEIRTLHLPDTSLERYHQTNLFGRRIVKVSCHADVFLCEDERCVLHGQSMALFALSPG